MIKLLTTSDKETEEIGLYLGKVLKKGNVVCLSGSLGAGKTVFIKGIASAHNVHDPVTSPTFTLINEYEGDVPIYHFDVYRISHVDEMYDIGFDEYIYGEGIVLIEWADLIKEILPHNVIWVFIDRFNSYDEKTVNNRLISIDFREDSFIEEKFFEMLKSKGKQVLDN
ncbi:MAG TPA: tRNA (adenosine(37)-N6)-threonylcarbamoyltransferase complex ATPase subunit type 1 TsaE [Clostridiaceae bacterium]|nr:tRNA (adenosine(37)-N6)-threonylcarbamoyltransferase complex ATPase subunit type 1 TsaE [Clostridiaceae bacterium]